MIARKIIFFMALLSAIVSGGSLIFSYLVERSTHTFPIRTFILAAVEFAGLSLFGLLVITYKLKQRNRMLQGEIYPVDSEGMRLHELLERLIQNKEIIVTGDDPGELLDFFVIFMEIYNGRTTDEINSFLRSWHLSSAAQLELMQNIAPRLGERAHDDFFDYSDAGDKQFRMRFRP